MKKWFVIGSVVLVLLGLLGGGVYHFFFTKEEVKPPRYKRDPQAWTLPPVAYPMKGKTFRVPEMAEVTVTLDKVFPATKHDYPMGTFSIASSSGEGQLYVMDDLATPLENGLRAVPIVVNGVGTGTFMYLAIIEETETTFNHTVSLFLGDRIRITGLTRSGNQVTVSYGIHDQNQNMSEVPNIATTAIIDIGAKTFVQEGRKPWVEAALAAKQFVGLYQWQKTTLSDDTVVTPSNSSAFTLMFDGTRITLGTDCNSGVSDFTPPLGTSTALAFGPVVATEKFCQSSEEGPYFDMIEQVTTFKEGADSLTFTLKDGSVMLFVKPAEELPMASEETATTP